MADEATVDQPHSQEATVETPVKSEATSVEETDVVSSADEKSSSGTGKVSFSIWPPTQRTRDAIIERLVKTLSTTSVLSKRYGTVPEDDAKDVAKQIEDQAFAAANPAATSPDDDGIEILQVYSKEISRRMIEYVKSRSASAAPAAAADDNPAPDEGSGPAADVKENEKDEEGPKE